MISYFPLFIRSPTIIFAESLLDPYLFLIMIAFPNLSIILSIK
jgi:hypothetical protein